MSDRIKLIKTLPVDPSHGMTAGREFDVIRQYGGCARWYVMGDAGEEVGVMAHEAEEVTAEKADGE